MPRRPVQRRRGTAPRSLNEGMLGTYAGVLSGKGLTALDALYLGLTVLLGYTAWQERQELMLSQVLPDEAIHPDKAAWLAALEAEKQLIQQEVPPPTAGLPEDPPSKGP
jgi:hypothetical protein